jgi:HEAT repeat protein
MTNSEKTNSGRKLFFGLFVFPLLIAVGMAVLLCSVVLITNEKETPESLVAAIKTGAPGKRWQKAFELSNELNRKDNSLRSESVMREIASILGDQVRYDEKTRSYMAIALSHFSGDETRTALIRALGDPSEDVKLYSLWALGAVEETEVRDERRNKSINAITPFLNHENKNLRKMAVYVLGATGDKRSIPALKALLNDSVEDIRWNAALSLARLHDSSGLDVLLKMLERDRLAAELGMDEVGIESVMINAVKGLALIQKPESIKILESVSKGDKSLKVRQAAIDAIQYQKQA